MSLTSEVPNKALLRNRDYAIALVARTGSRFGDEVALVALTLRLQESGGRPWEIAALLAAGLVPFILLAKIVGRVVDSADSRRILVVSTIVQAAGCAPLVFTHRLSLIVALVGLIAVGGAFSSTAWQVLIPRVVGEDQIGRATSLSQSAFTIGSIAAPAAAGLLSGLFGTGVPLAVDTVSFVLMTAAAALIRTRRVAADPDSASQSESGWACLRRDKLLGTLVAGLSAFVLLALMLNIVQVFLVRVTLHASATWYGCTEAAWMVGVLIGSVLAGRLAADAGRGRATVLGAGLMSLVFLAYGGAPSVAWLLPAGLLGGVGNGYVNVCISTLVMTRTPDHLRGRVMAALGASVNTVSVLSLAIGGAVTAVLGIREVYVAAGLSSAVVTVCLGLRMAALWRRVPAEAEPAGEVAWGDEPEAQAEAGIRAEAAMRRPSSAS
ncbi:MAG: MFS transporter [Acidimicrobiales bacterium]